MSTASILLWNAVLLASAFAVLWLASLRLRDASIVDIFWGPGFALVASATYLAADGWPVRMALVTFLVLVWGLRLAAHLARRNLGAGEDYRYRAMRRRWGERFPAVSLVVVFGLQAALMWIVSLPVVIAQTASSPATLVWTDLAGVLVWTAGFAFEAVGDAQLAAFKADPANRGRVLDRGLWAWTRHPNYFGDACVWWGLWLIAAGTPGGWPTIVSPLAMTFLLRRVSGVPLLERHLERTRPGYAEYMRRTSGFFPMPPRSGQAGG